METMKLASSFGFIASVVFDTAVFVAISVKVLEINAYRVFHGWSWIMAFIRGEGLGHISMVLLRSGQLYYLYVYVLASFCHY